MLAGIFVCMRRCCSVLAQQARQTVETVAFDPFRNEGLPTVYGFAEKLILVFFVALNVAGLRDCGFQDLQKKRATSLLEDQLSAAEVALTREQVRLEVDRLLELPSNAGIIHLGIEVIALISSICPVEAPDSARTRVFVVENSVAEYSHEIRVIPHLTKRHDTAVDVIAGTC